VFLVPPSHKRDAGDREISFRHPSFACLACNDTGLVTNGDGLVNSHLADYDCLRDGRPNSGSDLALVCNCPAATSRPAADSQGRGGYREADGRLRRLGDGRSIGSELTAAQLDDLRRQRAKAWAETEATINGWRRQQAAGLSPALPWFIRETGDEVRRATAQLAERPASAGGLQSIGSCLVEALAGPSLPRP